MSFSIFSPPPTGPNEPESERIINRMGALEARDDTKLTAICREACRLVRGTSSLLSILHGETQYVIAAHGFPTGAYSRKNSLSGHALAADKDFFFVSDLSTDERFAENPWINGERARFRFYAASLIRPYDRLAVGVISVLDDKMRPTISEFEHKAMMIAANEATARIMQFAHDRNISSITNSKTDT